MRIIFICLLFLLTGSHFVYTQADIPKKDGFEKYNKDILSPSLAGRHQLLFSSNYTMDLDEETFEAGNIAHNQSAGIGFGYLYRIHAFPWVTKTNFAHRE